MANSVKHSMSYITSDMSNNDYVKHSQGYPRVATLPASFYIGGSTSSTTFSGFLRHVKIFKKFRSIG